MFTFVQQPRLLVSASPHGQTTPADEKNANALGDEGGKRGN